MEETNSIGIFISIVVGFFFLYLIYRNYVTRLEAEEKERLEKEEFEKEKIRQREIIVRAREAEQREIERLNWVKEIESIYEPISRLTFEFEALAINETLVYVNHRKVSKWKSSALTFHNLLSKIPYNKIGLDPSRIVILTSFYNYFINADIIRRKRNEAFVKSEVENKIFDNIGGRKLDLHQRSAILKDEDNSLIIAGAGSGKTTVIEGKVSYLVNVKKVDPKDILLISFTKNSSVEMEERVNGKMKLGVEVMTFHKLGLSIIGNSINRKPSIFDESKLKPFLIKLIKEMILDSSYSSIISNYLVKYSKPIKLREDFTSMGEYISFIRDNGIKSYKKVTKVISGKKTLLREQCKSIEEVIIANYLFLNNINYEYERPYEIDTATKEFMQYRPDFHLIDYGIYLEHFGVDHEGNVPNWFDPINYSKVNARYQESMEWKINIHEMHGTSLIQTFSHENSDGILLTALEEKLRTNNVAIKPKTNEEIWQILNDVAEDEISGFYDLLLTFLALFKANNYSIEVIKDKITKIHESQEFERNIEFIKIFEVFILKYQEKLKLDNVIDFNDMINEAFDIVNAPGYSSNYRYVIVDEYQDISFGRYNLIKALRDKGEDCRLFCVGDDWQSIYRFAGSDISLFTHFEGFYGAAEVTNIEKTYRFNQNLVEQSSKFILKNPFQLPKKMESDIPINENTIEIIYNSDIKGHNGIIVSNILSQITAQHPNKKLSILILGRYSFDIKSLVGNYEESDIKVDMSKEKGPFKISYIPNKNLTIEFKTVHKAKGLQADYVIVINCTSGRNGFPSQHSDDPILNLVLSNSDQFPNGEERRLFYVALTRTKNKVFLISNEYYKSKFVLELESLNQEKVVVNCNRCKTGMLSRKSGVTNGKEWILETCSNKNWGCDYKVWH